MSESPRELAAKIAGGEDPVVWADAITVSNAYLQLLKTVDEKPQEPPVWRGVYPMFCRDPKICEGRTACPRNPSCSE